MFRPRGLVLRLGSPLSHTGIQGPAPTPSASPLHPSSAGFLQQARPSFPAAPPHQVWTSPMLLLTPPGASPPGPGSGWGGFPSFAGGLT